MRKRVAIGIVVIFTAIIPIIVVSISKSNVVWERDGHDSYYWPEIKPQGITVQIYRSFLLPNRFIVGVGQDFVDVYQGVDSGYINLTHSITGQEWGFNYDLGSSSAYVEYKWATIVWDLPEGTYSVEVYNYNSAKGERYDIDYRILSAGAFRDLSRENAFIDDSSELMAMYFAISIGMFIAIAGIILIIRKEKEKLTDYQDKSAVAKKLHKGWD